jgi:hypothetical protein
MRDSIRQLSFVKRIAPVSLTLITSSLLVSCGNFDATGLAKKSMNSVANLIPRRRVPVTEVREKDLRKMATGADRAMAWDRHLDSKRYVFFRPKHYKAPKLPAARSLPEDGGILPPLHPGRGSSVDGRGSLPQE